MKHLCQFLIFFFFCLIAIGSSTPPPKGKAGIEDTKKPLANFAPTRGMSFSDFSKSYMASYGKGLVLVSSWDNGGDGYKVYFDGNGEVQIGENNPQFVFVNDRYNEKITNIQKSLCAALAGNAGSACIIRAGDYYSECQAAIEKLLIRYKPAYDALFEQNKKGALSSLVQGTIYMMMIDATPQKTVVGYNESCEQDKKNPIEKNIQKYRNVAKKQFAEMDKAQAKLVSQQKQQQAQQMENSRQSAVRVQQVQNQCHQACYGRYTNEYYTQCVKQCQQDNISVSDSMGALPHLFQQNFGAAIQKGLQ